MDGSRKDNGIMLALVVDSNDPEGMGNVKVEYPQLANQQSNWAPVATLMASADAGTWFRPKPGDQVVVAFEQGDPMNPIVLASLYSSADPPPPDDGAPGDNNWQQIVSRSGAIFRFDDTPGSEKVELIDSGGQLSVTLDSSGGKIAISAQGDIEIDASGKLTLSAREIEISAQAGVTIDGGTKVAVSAAQIELN